GARPNSTNVPATTSPAPDDRVRSPAASSTARKNHRSGGRHSSGIVPERVLQVAAHDRLQVVHVRTLETRKLSRGTHQSDPVQLTATPQSLPDSRHGREALPQHRRRPTRSEKDQTDAPVLAASDGPQTQLLGRQINTDLLRQLPRGMATQSSL